MNAFDYARGGLFDANRPRSQIQRPQSLTAPPSVDWRQKGFMTPVRSQEPCLGCTAFGLMAVLEAHHKQKTGGDIELAAAWVHACVSKKDCRENHRIAALADALAARTTLPLASEVQGAPSDCGIAGTFALPKLVRLPDRDAIKDHLSRLGPVATVLSVTPSFFDHRAGNEIYKATGNFSDNHVICLSGFDEQGGFWRAKNSLGPTWSDDGGYVRIAFGSCEIGDYDYSSYGVASP